jgi:hypothetical protein
MDAINGPKALKMGLKVKIAYPIFNVFGSKLIICILAIK